MTVMLHVKALEAGQSSQGTSEPITPALLIKLTTLRYILMHMTVMYRTSTDTYIIEYFDGYVG